ncbi:type III-A CRISPR-associated RAMP protein Csm4 [Oceanicella actignis]|uniref:CRISPR system Cms protein Csm4 n=1 Tax=Oceanicella actignis TaxID=1189325 RepID=A0A1M7S1M4_9RHOB|nr:hypothetical protein [Oceanicella actignis]SES91482.1 CRISPR-associated protein, Csm4 family [Oceanicella actignis]SHN52413.1 CRISPR-associated protein Csm4 [Oceanicella actignis]
MTLYRVTLRLESPLGTPLVGPTLFGQLCWLIRDGDGESALGRWLDDPRRAWIVSDGFPSGHLPRPLVKPRALSADKLETVKKRKRLAFVSREAWLKHRSGWDETALPEHALMPEPASMRRLAHNHVHRSGRGTLAEGGLFFLEEDWRFAQTAPVAGADPRRADVYVQTLDAADRVQSLFELLGDQGFGRDSSTGRGRWTVEAVVEDGELLRASGERRMSLSRGVVDPQGMEDALWRLEPHYGRAGARLTLAGVSPFKRPVLLTRPGMTFRPRHQGPFGRMLEGLHHERPEIRLNARHIAIPFSEGAEAAA